jgi:hypothetical protein
LHDKNGLSGMDRLLANTKLADDLAVTISVDLLQVVQQPTTLAHKHEEATARTVIFLMGLEMFRQLANPFTQDCDLNLWTSGVGIMCTELLDNVCLFCGCQHSCFYS